MAVGPGVAAGIVGSGAISGTGVCVGLGVGDAAGVVGSASAQLADAAIRRIARAASHRARQFIDSLLNIAEQQLPCTVPQYPQLSSQRTIEREPGRLAVRAVGHHPGRPPSGIRSPNPAKSESIPPERADVSLLVRQVPWGRGLWRRYDIRSLPSRHLASYTIPKAQLKRQPCHRTFGPGARGRKRPNETK